MMCGEKVRPDFGQILKFSPLNQVDISAPSWYEALYSPMIVAVVLLGPLTMSDNPSQAAWSLGTCQTSMMCCQKVRPDFTSETYL